MTIGEVGALAFWVVVATAVYLVPTCIAVARRHYQVLQIVVINLVGGLLCGLGWIIALVWACGRTEPRPIVVQMSRGPESTSPGWYPDPNWSGRLRWWNGTAWTDSTQ